ncbi:hypothetical protein IVB45_02150 [Bradyrhizobium sp. 4]|uniref:type IV secretory system conjugative DNA transfer family protein n=1 Tax=Bradyrhizobium sp. 4 TaxID=2782678 RepID=UPI001FFF7EA7|nr:type IV secretory system conjugative DNA transfer family protein [Bradyrhizobium sp. 4]UPJ35836.1 hypothetical protein IVB45_02150 [Bradyrhizobium sp. 4]
MAHKYLIGATGTGKSTLLKQLIPEMAFCLIDKHGTLAKEIADSRPCVFWKPADLSHPIGLNPLQDVHPDDRWKVTADVVAIFADVWKLGPETPRLLYYLRASVRLLLDSPNTTLLGIRRILSDSTYRARLEKKCTDIETRQTWTEFAQKTPKQQAEEIGSLQNKVAAFADPLPLRYILGQTTTLHIDKILERGEVLICDLSGLGDEPAALIGALLINSFKQAAQSAREPKHYDLFIDEFQSFGTSTIATILSEARKWGLSLTIAHQFISQLSDEVRDAVLGNAGTLISFRVGPNDAPIMGTAMDCHPSILMNLGIGEYRFVSTLNGRRTDATLAQTEVAELERGHLPSNVRNTAANFGRSRALVEAMLSKSTSLGWGNWRRNG